MPASQPLRRRLDRGRLAARAYILLRLTRCRTKHTRALKGLARFPRNLRTVRVRISEPALRRIQARIAFDAHEADGFHLRSSSVDIYTGTVTIGLITKRADHAEYFRARYGPHARTFVIRAEPTSPDCAKIVGYRAAPEGLSLELTYESGGGATFDRVELVVYEDRVEIGVVEQGPNGPRTLELRYETTTVVLARPLGGRIVGAPRRASASGGGGVPPL